MFEDIISWSNVLNAHHKTLKGKAKFKISAIRFNENQTQNLIDLVNEVSSGSYSPLPYVEFSVYEPKERLIHAPRYRDKIVQHMVNNVLRDFYEPKFIFDSYACIREKGNERAIKRLHHFQRGAIDEFGSSAYLCKVDIRKFFYTIDRNILKQVLKKKITCNRTLTLLDTLIDHSIDCVGLPLGNLISQLFANVLMNEVDQYSKRNLECRRYLRYADDIFVFCSSKTEARELLIKLTLFLEQKLNLTTNKSKSSISKLEGGFNGLGFRYFHTHRIITTQNKKAILRRVSNSVEGLTTQQIQSWCNFSKQGSTKMFREKVHLLNNTRRQNFKRGV